MKKKVLYLLVSLIGIALLLAGLFLFTTDETKLYSGLCTGIGSAVAVLGIGSFILSIVTPSLEAAEIKKQKEIEVKDERNTAIREKAGYMVARCMNYVITAFIFTLAFMGADKVIILMAASLIVIELVMTIVFSNYYSKRM